MPGQNKMITEMLVSAQAPLRALRYYMSRARTLHRPAPHLTDLALHTHMVARPGLIDNVTPFVWAEHLDRIQDTQWFTANVIINDHMKLAKVTLTPAYAYTFRDIFLVDGSLYLNGRRRLDLRSSFLRRGLRKYSLLPAAPVATFDSAVAVSGVASSMWFGHWLEDELPLQLLAMGYGTPISHVRTEYGHEPGWRELAGVPTPVQVGTARVRDFVYIDEFAQNASKASRYWKIREKLAARPAGKRAVFLHRGANGDERMIANQEEVLAFVEKAGFVIVDIRTPLQDLIGVLNQADLVMGVEGSHLAHALYAMKSFGTLVILTPPNRAYTTVADIAPFCGLHASMFIGRPSEGFNFTVDVDELGRFIEDSLRDARHRKGDIERFLETLDGHERAPA